MSTATPAGLAATVGFKVSSQDYRDVAALDGTGARPGPPRHHDLFDVIIRLAYQFSPGFSLIGLLQGNLQENRGDGTIDRDARGFEAMTGLSFEATALWRGYVEVGIIHQDFLDPTLKTIDTLAYDGKLEWLMSPLVTLAVGGGRQLATTGFADASGRIDTRVWARLDYELLRNLVVTFEGKYGMSEFAGISREDRFWSAAAGIEYFHTKNFGLSLRFEHEERLSTDDAFYFFERNRVTVGAKIRF